MTIAKIIMVTLVAVGGCMAVSVVASWIVIAYLKNANRFARRASTLPGVSDK